jgi:NCAIR mutase (PurE)-related protein
MNRERVLELLAEVARGGASPEQALEKLSWLPVEEVWQDAADPFARLDHHRPLRNGHPEVVLCSGKTVAQVVEICARFEARGGGFLATRAEDAVQTALARRFPGAQVSEIARLVHLPAAEPAEKPAGPPVVVVSAGTADLPVAEEAALTVAAMGHPVERLYDMGVAGFHRILGEHRRLQSAGAVIVVAGMEGALPSVVGGLVAVPVIAVPTSVGYGAAFGGLAALLGMLNSCAAGVAVVNIDNGFGAACAATRILSSLRKRAESD